MIPLLLGRWRTVAGIAAVLLAGWAGWAGAEARWAARLAKVEAAHAQQIAAVREAEAAQAREAERIYAEQAKLDEARLASMQDRVRELNAYIDKKALPARRCLSGADSEKLRGLW